jgi:hypothetical protein
MAIPLRSTVQYQKADMDAARGLLRRMYTGEDRSLAMLVFGTERPPMPTYFQDRNHSLTRTLAQKIKDTLILTTTYIIVAEWKLNPQQVDLLQIKDRRIAALRQRLTAEIDSIPVVQQLQAARVQHMNTNS